MRTGRKIGMIGLAAYVSSISGGCGEDQQQSTADNSNQTTQQYEAQIPISSKSETLEVSANGYWTLEWLNFNGKGVDDAVVAVPDYSGRNEVLKLIDGDELARYISRDPMDSITGNT
jgi:hypothetical protein